jgi:hypothetical protein
LFFCGVGRDAIWPEIVRLLRTEYGTGATSVKEQFHTGPFSFLTYLEFMMERGAWGDRLCMLGFMLVTNSRTTVLNYGSQLFETRINHDLDLRAKDAGGFPSVDTLLIHAKHHFSVAGEYNI